MPPGCCEWLWQGEARWRSGSGPRLRKQTESWKGEENCREYVRLSGQAPALNPSGGSELGLPSRTRPRERFQSFGQRKILGRQC